MKLVFFLIFVLGLIFPPPAVYAGPDGEALRQTDVRIKTVCIYTKKSQATNEILARIPMVSWGNGSFIDHVLGKHNVLTASHVVVCDEKLGFSVDSAVWVLFNNIEYKASVLKTSPQFFPNFSIYQQDLALLEVALPENVSHGHITPLVDHSFKVGDEVLIRSKRPIKDSVGNVEWLPYLKKVLIAEIFPNYFYFSEDVYMGMSGGAVLFWKDDKYRVVGVLTAGYMNENEVPLDAMWAAIIKKEFLELELKTAP